MGVVNILLVGVGGQGTVLASNVLSRGLSEAGYNVKMSEIHGMSQRGGSVFTQVRFGKEEVYSPVIEKGKVDYLVAFEKMEALRYLDMLKPDGKVIVNDEELPSAPIQAGLAEYPEGILEELRAHADTTVIPATEIARELGNERVMNIVLFGALAKLLKLDDIDWKDVIARTVKAKFVDINLKAFDRGQELVV
jgi:indolepyruvate ferredoxin oxidoreductase beta subunit